MDLKAKLGAKNTFPDDISEPRPFPLVQTESPEHISSGIPEVFRHSLKPDRIFVMLERLNLLADDGGS